MSSDQASENRMTQRRYGIGQAHLHGWRCVKINNPKASHEEPEPNSRARRDKDI